MLEQLVGEGTDLLQREGRPLREEADPPSVDVAVEVESARHTIHLGTGGDDHGLIDTDADDMVATIVDGRFVLVRGPDCVSRICMIDDGFLLSQVARWQRPEPRKLIPSEDAERKEAARATRPVKDVVKCISTGFGGCRVEMVFEAARNVSWL